MSNCADDVELTEWADTMRIPVALWRVGPRTNKPLANLLTELIDDKFPSKAAAARAIGIWPGAIKLILLGALVGNVVTLSGVTTFTNHPVVPVGVPVTFVANATGDITWTFDVGAVIAGGRFLVFTSTGSVVIAQ